MRTFWLVLTAGGQLGWLAIDKGLGDYVYESPHKDRNRGVCVYLFKVLVATQVTVSVPMTTRSKDIWLLSTYLVISENKYLAAKYLTFG